MRRAGAELRRGAAAFYRGLLSRLLVRAPGGFERLPTGGTCRDGFLAQRDLAQGDVQQCLQLCDEAPGCEAVAFNDLCCMLYEGRCDPGLLRTDGGRAAYAAWRR
ncbi:unnamed protein product, partial [Prorocentrum cordatum]